MAKKDIGAGLVSVIHCIRDKAEMMRATRDWQAAGETVCLVPTMGGIHAGHLALIAHARTCADRTVVSIYVNPTQFAAGEDFDLYPRKFDEDCRLIQSSGGCDAIYAPVNMYGDGHATNIIPGGVALPMEGETRPHFFSGVATVVYKLFTHVPANMAVFGEKDFQQLAVVRQMVRDLDMPIGIIEHETIREADGLALSSRNQYLTAAERKIAPALYTEMRRAATEIRQGAPTATVMERAKQAVLAAGFDRVDYLDLRHPDDLTRTTTPHAGNRIFAAAWLGSTRLIDNCPLG